jgi:hypothetical protein
MLVSNIPDGVFIVGFTVENAPPGPNRPGDAPVASAPQ